MLPDFPPDYPRNCAVTVYADINNLQLPAWAPYLTEEGMLFSYQQYEIAAYAAGIPAFVISFDQLKPYLTEAGAALIKEK